MYAHVSKVGKPNIHDQACETFYLGQMGQTNPITTFFAYTACNCGVHIAHTV